MDDDNTGYTGNESAFVPTNAVADETPQQTAPAGSNAATSNTGTTQAGKSGASINGYGIGKRKINPLGAYSSYTYQLSLYMISPDAYDEFNKSGRKNIFIINGSNGSSTYGSGGAYLIAQSGGVNNDATRAPGFEYDFYIDNLEIKAAVSGGGAGSNGSTINYAMTFTITEPYGFSFITNLKRAKVALEKYSATTNYKNHTNPSRGFFILGIKFLGYDAAGNLITQSPLINEPDPTFQRFYDINITKVDFKIDGKATVYRIDAASIPIQAAMGTKRGMIDKGANQLTGRTVGDILNQLMEKVTNDQQKDVEAKAREFANTYKIKFIGDASDIENSSIVNQADLNKIKWPMSLAKDKNTVNPSLEIKAQPNSKERIIAFNRETPIIQAITSTITASDYLIKGLQSVYKSEETADPKTDSQESVDIDSNKRLKWFSVVPFVEKTRFDNILKDWTFDITYQVKTYEIPILKSAYADKTTPYYGPVKRYDFWYTGKNTEVLRYEQSINTAFFTVALSGQDATAASTGGSAQVPLATGKRTYSDRLGQLGVGKEAQNTITTDLTGGHWAEAKIEILGDPDFLSNPTPTGNENDKSFYGPDGYTIDYTSGQIFIEIRFLQPIDYDNGTGILNVSDKILFWDYPASVAEMLNGAISYKLIKLTHNFKGGRFTQNLELAINTFGDVQGPKMSEIEEQQRENQEINDNESQRFRNRTTGLTPDQPVGAGTTAGNQTTGSDSPVTTQSTTNAGVANDDANVEAAWQQDYFSGGRGGI